MFWDEVNQSESEKLIRVKIDLLLTMDWSWLEETNTGEVAYRYFPPPLPAAMT